MAVLIHPGAIPAPFTSSKKGSFNFASQRKAVDYYATAVKTLENRLWQRDQRDRPFIQPDLTYYNELSLPCGLHESPVFSVTTKFVRAAANKSRCPIYCISWVPDGRRLITGAATGEFTLWNGINFNFESILQGHDCSVRSMTWSHNGVWMTSTDDRGFVKYWQANLNNVHTFQAHNDPVRSSSFSPTDTKLATCSEDGTVRTFDFVRCAEEFILRGHGADVMSVDWHPRKNLLASGSKDTQQPVKLWDPKAGQSIATIHAHKASVQSVSWNRNGNWLLTAAWDALIKVFDIRNMKELHTLKGHKKDVNTVAWHPVHESLFASGGGDGSILFWTIGNEREIGGMESAHDSFIWNLSWHPLGHVLVSCSSDHTSKFWCRNRPGEEMRDRYNTASALITEEAVEENYSFPMLGIGGGSGNQRQAITLPPPTWSSHSQRSSSQGMGANVDSSQQSSQEKDATPLNVPVLGADIIAEQFRDKPKPPAAPVASDNQATPTTHPPDGPFNFPPQRPFDEQGRPPPENMNFHRPDQERGGMALQGPPPPPPPEHFRHPPPDQREWHSRGPPAGREFVRPEFRGPPPPGEFNRPSPYSWQRSAANFRERRSSYEEHRFPPPEHANPYVYRRPEPEPQRDPRDQHRPEWREGPPPPRRQPTWEEGRGPPQQPPPMREEFPGRGGPGGSGGPGAPGGMLGPRRPPEDFDRHEEFRHERHGGGGGYPPHSGPPGGPQGQEHPPQRQPQPVQGPQQPQLQEMWERAPPPPQQQPPPQGQRFPEPRRQPSAPLDPRAQGRHPLQEGRAPHTSSAPPSDPQRTGFPHVAPDKQQQPPHQRGGPPRNDQPRVPPHPPRSEAQGPPPPQRFIERPSPGSDIQRPHPPPTSEAQRLHLPPTSEAHRPHPQPSSEVQRPRPPPISEAQQQRPGGGLHQKHPAMSPHQAPPPSLGPGDKFFQQPGPPHTPPGQGQPRFPGPSLQGPAGVRPSVQKFGGQEMRVGPRGPPPPNQPQQFPRPPPSGDRQGHPPLHNRPAPPPSHERQPPGEQGHPLHDRQGHHPPPPHNRQGPPPSHGRQGHPPPVERQGHPPPHDRHGHPSTHDRQGHPPPHDRQGHPPPHDRQGHPPPHERQVPTPPQRFQPPPHQQQPPQQQFRRGAPPTAGPGQQPQAPRHPAPNPADPRMNRPGPSPDQPPPSQHPPHLPPPGGRGGQQFGGPPHGEGYPSHGHPPGKPYDGRGQGPPPGHMQQAPPPSHVQQAPPSGHMQQGPPPGRMQQAPPPGHMQQQAPPPGHMQQMPQGGNSPHWSGPRGGPPPPQFREDPSSQGGYEHSRDPRDRRREPHPLSNERHDRSSPHRRGSDDREVPSSKRSRVEKDQDGHARQR